MNNDKLRNITVVCLFWGLLVVPMLLDAYKNNKVKKQQISTHAARMTDGLKNAPVESLAVFDIDSVYTYFNKLNAYAVLTPAVVAPEGYCFFKIFADSVIILPKSRHCPESIRDEIRKNYPMKQVEQRWLGGKDTTVKISYSVATLNGTSYSVEENDTITDLPRYVCTKELGSILGVRRPINYQELEACEKAVVYSSTKDTTVTSQPDSVGTLEASPVILFNSTTKEYALRGFVDGGFEAVLAISNFNVVLGNKSDAHLWSPEHDAVATSNPVADMTNQSIDYRYYSMAYED